MKKVFMLFAMMMAFVTFASAQKEITLKLDKNEKLNLRNGVNKALNEMITCFDGKMDWDATTIDQVKNVSNHEIHVEGKVRYNSKKCGTVYTSYQVDITREGSKSMAKPCIYTPYCAFGIETGHEWDCQCKKWQIDPGEVFKVAVEIALDRYLSK